MMTNVDKIEKLLEELSQEVKKAHGAIMAVAIVPISDEESFIVGRGYGNPARIAVAIREAEKDKGKFQEILSCYKLISE